MFLEEVLVLKKLPRNGIVGIDLRTVARAGTAGALWTEERAMWLLAV